MMCPNAIPTDEHHGYECSVTGDSCIYLFPFINKCEMLDMDESEVQDDTA